MQIDLNLVTRYVEFQVGLLAELNHVRPDGVFPRGRGTVVYGGVVWSWHGHGAGFMFERDADGIVIDAHDYLSEPAVFDAWRLAQFAKSVGGEDVGFDQALAAILDLVDAGAVLELTEPHEPAGERRFRLRGAGA